MKHRIDVRGSIIPNNYKFYYDLFGADSTCPMDVQQILDKMHPGDELEVYINSPGGVIDCGSEIYTMLRLASNVTIYITGQACSAASIIAMAGTCYMAPTALMMVHCVSSGASGNHTDMAHMAEVLETADNALCTAYMDKAGMSREDALAMMEAETWLTAEQAKDKGLIDGIMFEEDKEPELLTASLFKLPTAAQMAQAKEMMQVGNNINNGFAAGVAHTDPDIVNTVTAKMQLLRLKGEER